jgi:hypothetical protein
MKKCKVCGKDHKASYHLANKISAKGYPVSQKGYKTAHEETSKKEKAKFPRKDYTRLKHMDETIPDDELIGKNSKSGKITVSKKVPKKLRAEVAFHEKVESKKLRKKKKNE